VADYIDPIVYSIGIRDRFGDVDLVLSAGDLPLDYLEYIVSTLNTPLYFVFGNHNLEHFRYYRYHEKSGGVDSVKGRNIGATYVGFHVRKTEDGLLIAGLGGSMLYNHSPSQYSNFRMTLEILKITPRLLWNRLVHGRFLDILLTHAPPEGIHDKTDLCHQGFRPFLRFMRVFKPRYLVHGHIHLYDMADVRKSQYYDTTVINAYGHYVIEMEERSKE
jgi:calcineurin-like phosphoesterase family protein